MGFGALVYKKIISTHYFKEFVKVELILSLVGGVAPILVLIFDSSFNSFAKGVGVSFFSNSIQVPLFIANHFLIVMIGFLSGLELPLLMDMSKQFKANKSHQVLALRLSGHTSWCHFISHCNTSQTSYFYHRVRCVGGEYSGSFFYHGKNESGG